MNHVRLTAMRETGKPLLGFVGQGYIGKNYADDFEKRGYETVRYSLEAPYSGNREKIASCDIVFIAVPTPTTPEGFDGSVVEAGIQLVGKGKIVVIKSTIVPGTTASFQERYQDRILCYSPEFLSEVTAAHDAAHPFSNIIGIGANDAAHQEAAVLLHAILPPTAYMLTCTSTQAELIKYAHNGSGFVEIVFFNLMYDLAQKLGADWGPIQEALAADPYIANRYAKPVHKSGRGAGGHCFIKDFAALRAHYDTIVGDSEGAAALAALEQKNLTLLRRSNKDQDLVRGVYGELQDSKAVS